MGAHFVSFSCDGSCMYRAHLSQNIFDTVMASERIYTHERTWHIVFAHLILFFTMKTVGQTELTACLFVERGSNGRLFYDFDRSRAAVDLAVAYVNEVILPTNISIRIVYKDAGPNCAARNHIVALALELMVMDQQVCSVFIGPGKLAKISAKILRYYGVVRNSRVKNATKSPQK